MPLIQHQLKPFSFGTSGLDLSPFVTQLVLKWPRCEIHTPQIAELQFTVTLLPGYSTDTLDEVRGDNLLRRDASQYALQIAGFQVWTGWIETYRYNPLTFTGLGKMRDNLGLINYDRSAFEVPDVTIGAGQSLDAIVTNLLTIAGQDVNGNQIFNSISIADILTGSLEVPVVSRSPVQDAQKFAGADCQWLYATPLGVIQLAGYPGFDNGNLSPAFMASIAEMSKFEPDLTATDFEADELIVTGGHEIAKPVLPSTTTDSKGRPLYQEMVVMGLQGLAFPNVDTFDDSTQTVILKKTRIDYEYRASKQGSSVLDTLYQTTTQTWLPTGLALQNDTLQNYPGTGLTSEPILTQIDTERPGDGFKQTQQIGAIAFPNSDAHVRDIGFVIVSQSTDTSQNMPLPPKPAASTGSQYADTTLNVESTPPQTDYKVENFPVVGVANGLPVWGSPFLRRPLIENVGYLYDEGQANILANFLLNIAYQRRDAYLVEMPPPQAWLANPTPFMTCDLYNGRWVVDAPELRIDASNGTDAKINLIFTANKAGSLAQNIQPPLDPPFLAPSNFSGALAIAPPADRAYWTGVAIAPFAFVAFNGTPPYTWSVAVGSPNPLPGGLGLDSASGILSGTPSGVVGYAGVTVQVTDSLSNVATVNANFSVVLPSEAYPPIQIDVARATGLTLQPAFSANVPTYISRFVLGGTITIV